MFELLNYEETTKDDLFIDVRSRGEFDDFHIPGSINFPVLNDEERKIVGTLYDNGSKREAKRSAIRFVSAKLLELEDLIYKHRDRRIIFTCARGGYRSKTIASLFFTLGYNVYKLKGGIKSYRHYINEKLPEKLSKISLVTLYAPTGSGKTEILHLLNSRNIPIIDLENLANHMGSTLGGVGLGKANSQKMFESLLFEAIDDEPKTYFIEGESKRIGNIVMPDLLYEKILDSKKIYLETPMSARIERLKKTYAKPELIEELEAAIENLSKYLGKETRAAVEENMILKNYDEVARLLCEKYYDHNYRFRADEKTLFIENDDIVKTVSTLLEFYVREIVK